jgi:tetratricopeptide (TPR) repeat protein
LGVRPLYLWIGVAVVPLVVVTAMLVLANHKTAPGNAPPVADTSGSYQELVQRANSHFDHGKPYIDQGNFDAAAPYFVAAAQEYGAAWSQLSTDPAVGTDFATSLFYAGDVQGAISMVDKVLKLKPQGGVLQKALLNKGNFLAMAGRVAMQSGQSAKGRQLLAQAKASYQASIKVDPASDVAAFDRQGITDLSTTGAPSATPSAPGGGSGAPASPVPLQ